MAKNKEEPEVKDESEIIIDEPSVDEKLQKYLKPNEKEQAPKKDIRAIRSVNADGRLLTVYNILKNNEGYDKSFDDFLLDSAMELARDKYGIDLVIEKSMNPNATKSSINVRKQKQQNDEDEDPYDKALKYLEGPGSANPKEEAFRILMEQKKYDLLERQARVERMQLENEKIKIENERIRNGNTVIETAQNNHNNGNGNKNDMDMFKFMLDQNQKFYEAMAQIYKSQGTQKDDGKDKEYLALITGLYDNMNKQQADFYSTVAGLKNNEQVKKIEELEGYVSQMNPAVWLKQKSEEAKMLGEIFGGGSGKSKEELEREYALKLEELKIQREDKKEEREMRRAEALTGAIKDGLGAFTEHIGKPLGEALKSTITSEVTKMQQNDVNGPFTGTRRRIVADEPQSQETQPTEPMPEPVIVKDRVTETAETPDIDINTAMDAYKSKEKAPVTTENTTS